MGHEVTLVEDGDGVAILGDTDAVQIFLQNNGLASRPLSASQVAPIAAAAGNIMQVGSEVAANSGRWIKLTEKSAKLLHAGRAMSGSTVGVSRAILTEGGKTKHVLEFVKLGKGLLSPAALAGVGGVMTQLAMQQTFQEITDYLARIDGKLDDVLRSQKHKVIAELVGAGIVLDDAMRALDEVGRVSEITWSKIQSSSATIASTQSYALLELDAVISKLERSKADREMRTAVDEAAQSIGEWQAVIARCFQLDDAMGILELDRVKNDSPEEIESHRRALRAQREKRIALVEKQINRIFESIARASQVAYEGKLLHPANSRAIAYSARAINEGTAEFVQPLGIANGAGDVTERRWVEAAVEKRDDLVEDGAEVLKNVADFAGTQISNARNFASKLVKDITEKVEEHKSSKAKKELKE